MALLFLMILTAGAAGSSAQGADGAQPVPDATNSASTVELSPGLHQEQLWNWHAQNTDVVQGDPGFPASTGRNSLNSKGEVQETVTLNLYGGARLWRGAEVHADLLMWQGFGLTETFGVEGFPNGDAYKAGTETPNFTFAHLFVRQTIGLGGEQEEVPDDQLTLAGKQDISRLTFTLGRYSLHGHPGAIRFLAWLDEADFASYAAATAILLAHPPSPDVGQGRVHLTYLAAAFSFEA